MESIKIAMRALKIRGEAAEFLIQSIEENLEDNNVPKKEIIMKKIKDIYDDGIIVQCCKELEKDATGSSLKSYLNIQ